MSMPADASSTAATGPALTTVGGPALPPDTVCLALTTVAREADGAALARALLERRLIACGTLLPGARSFYRWEGRVADEAEVVLLLKTTAARLEALRAAFGGLHPYDVPELLVFESADGLAAYLGWVRGEVAE